MSALKQVADLLLVAEAMIRDGDTDRAAWRIADAGGRLRRYLDDNEASGVCGYDEMTGLGCSLPTMPR